eukprot:TRINITY_DN587_c0_g1_i1.p1 TRINITY_DN587_c0_g1~~TRINITY_DN587_c0_g1_i1.p1  ORF type:complete len:240 (-),score=50.19 TRINITY_DN587_c0_g1_i1:376-1095(-)
MRKTPIYPPPSNREVMEHIAKYLGLKSMDDWYRVARRQVWCSPGGSRMIKMFNNSFMNALLNVFPDHDWDLNRMDKPNNYYLDPENRRISMELIAKKLKIQKDEDWYQIRTKDILKAGGGGIASVTSSSVIAMVTSVYPEKDWQMWRFYGHVLKEAEFPRFIEWLGKKLNITKLEQWYKVSSIEHGIDKKNGLAEILTNVYPNHTWDHHLLSTSNKKSSQNRLFRILQQILPPDIGKKW